MNRNQNSGSSERGEGKLPKAAVRCSHLKNPGFTLIELLVYMAILGFVIVVAGRAYSDSAIMRIRSQNMVKTAEEVGKTANLIKEDISQMGTKVWGQNISDDYIVDMVSPKVYWNATATNGDSSSYSLFHNPVDSVFFDSIVFRKAAFDSLGRYLGIREISWAARAITKKLYRRCATVASCAGANCGTIDPDLPVCPIASSVSEANPVLMAENVVNFKFTPSTPGIAGNPQDTLFPLPGSANAYFTLLSRTGDTEAKFLSGVSQSSGTEVVVSSFSAKNAKDGKSYNQLYLAEYGEDNWESCLMFDFIKGETYAIEFKMPFLNTGDKGKNDSNSTQFLPGLDHIAAGLRANDGQVIAKAPNDILFYPPQDSKAASLARYAEFSVKETISQACVALTFAFYSPKASTGKLKFSDFKVLRKPDETFHFLNKDDIGYNADYGTELVNPIDKRAWQKTNVKAFELVLEMENRGERTGTFSRDGKGMAIITPNNGVIP